jgi:hypothetical protein
LGLNSQIFGPLSAPIFSRQRERERERERGENSAFGLSQFSTFIPGPTRQDQPLVKKTDQPIFDEALQLSYLRTSAIQLCFFLSIFLDNRITILLQSLHAKLESNLLLLQKRHDCPFSREDEDKVR